MSVNDLKQHYDAQLSNFPQGCQNNIRTFLTNGDETIHSTTVMQRHLMPALATPGKINKYVASAAKYFMYKLQDAGLGTVETAGKKSIVFRKRKWEKLEDDALTIVHACGVTSSTYKKGKR
jgi:hypothetical protein